MDKKIIVGVVTVFIIGLVVAATLVYQSKPREEHIAGSSPETPLATSSLPKNETKPLPSGGSPSYASAINLYGAKRIQFDNECHAIPTKLSLKNNTSVMFDNRSTTTRAIYLDGVRYYIGSLDFRIIPLSSKKLPHTVRIDCGTGKNNAQIILQ